MIVSAAFVCTKTQSCTKSWLVKCRWYHHRYWIIVYDFDNIEGNHNYMLLYLTKYFNPDTTSKVYRSFFYFEEKHQSLISHKAVHCCVGYFIEIRFA